MKLFKRKKKSDEGKGKKEQQEVAIPAVKTATPQTQRPPQQRPTSPPQLQKHPPPPPSPSRQQSPPLSPKSPSNNAVRAKDPPVAASPQQQEFTAAVSSSPAPNRDSPPLIEEAELKTPPFVTPPSQEVLDNNNNSNNNSTKNISSTPNSLSNLEEDAHRNAITRELVKKFVADIWNRGDLDLIPQVCSKSLRFNGSVGMDRVGHDGFARMVTTIRDALNDYHCEIHSMVVEGSKAFCRMRFTGRHTGPLLGFSPTGSQVAWMGAAEFTCKDGKIIKVWELGDVKSLEDQLSGN